MDGHLQPNQTEMCMTETALARMDTGEANRRILSKDEHRADFRRVEAASLKRKTRLASAEGKRMFARCFYSFQASMYFISAMGRTKLALEVVEQIEEAVRTKLEETTNELNQAIDGAELLLKTHSIETVATYDTVPLEIEIGVTSAMGRRYFELIHKLDQLMPMLQTLEIEEVIKEKQVEQQRSRIKRIVLAMSSTARNLMMGVRRRMNEADAKVRAAEEKKGKAGTVTQANSDGSATSGVEEPTVEVAASESPEVMEAAAPQADSETKPRRSRAKEDPGATAPAPSDEPASVSACL